MLAGLGLVLALWTLDALTNGLLFGAAAAVVLLAGLALLGAREPRRRVVPDVSLATALTALGLSLLVAGSALGTWLVFVGAGLTVVGLVAVSRERA
jgi:hypothetical protein